MSRFAARSASFTIATESLRRRETGMEGTLVSDEISTCFALRLDAAELAGALVRRKLAQSFAYRQKRLPEILAVAARQAVERSLAGRL